MTGGKSTRKTQKPVRVGELRPWSELPMELLELIVSRLSIEDTVRLTCVCKELRCVVRSIRVVNQSPWLLFSPIEGGMIKFFEPSQGKFYVDDFPELMYIYVHCSKDGWVLYSQLSGGIFLFNPFTNSIIDLPYHDIDYCESRKVALSCAPTSPGCVLCTIDNVFLRQEGFSMPSREAVSIGIFHPGDAEWTTVEYQNPVNVYFRCGVDPVFCNGLFYCLSSGILVGVFDPQKHTWSILPVPRPKLLHLSSDDRSEIHMVEFKGEVLLVSVSYPDKPLIFKLDLSIMKWVEMKSLNGATLFVSSHSAFATIDVPRISRNSVYFSKSRSYGKSSYLYSLDDCKYHPAKQMHEFRSFPKAVWIQPPKMSHLLFEELY